VKTCCVIVCYRPDPALVKKLCADLASDGAEVILVDNSEDQDPALDDMTLPAGCALITLGANTGIAHAQNVGIAAALAADAGVVVFFDQDSTITPGFLRTLTSPLRPGVPEIVSPLCFDDTTHRELPSLGVSRRGISNDVQRSTDRQPYPVDVVISSGTAATKEVFSVGGLLDESFFIDFVDTEWCLRCRDKGIPILVVPDAVMRHRIGSRAIHLSVMTVLVHNPARCYYQLRNCFLLFRRTHIPFLFSLKQFVSVFASRLLLLFFVSDRRAYLNAYVSALNDGIRGVAGRNPRDVLA